MYKLQKAVELIRSLALVDIVGLAMEVLTKVLEMAIIVNFHHCLATSERLSALERIVERFGASAAISNYYGIEKLSQQFRLPTSYQLGLID